MATAMVTLQGAGSFRGPTGLQWKQHQTRKLSGKVLDYYRHQSEFKVVIEADPEGPPEVATNVAEVVEEFSPLESAPSELPVEAPSVPATVEPESTPATEDDAALFSQSELRKLNKTELIELGSEGFGLTLNPKQTKEEMMFAILEAQG